MTTGRNDNLTACLPGSPQRGRTGPGRRPSGLRRPTAGGTQGAFTLLELILVLVIISVVLGIAAPSLRGFLGARRTADAAANLLAMAQYARSQAIAEGTVYRLNIDIDENAYWLTRQTGGVFAELATEYGRRFDLPATVRISLADSGTVGGVAQIQFYPSGRVDRVRILLVGAQDDAYIVANASATEPLRIFPVSEAPAL